MTRHHEVAPSDLDSQCLLLSPRLWQKAQIRSGHALDKTFGQALGELWTPTLDKHRGQKLGTGLVKLWPTVGLALDKSCCQALDKLGTSFEQALGKPWTLGKLWIKALDPLWKRFGLS